MILQSQPRDSRAWVTIASSGGVVALPAAAADADAAADAAQFTGLVHRLSEPHGFAEVLQLLLAKGIASAPSFALVAGDECIARVMLRGEADVAVDFVDPDEKAVTISGAGMASWTERVFEGARSLELRVPGSTWTLLLGSPETVPVETEVGETTLPPARHEIPARSMAGIRTVASSDDEASAIDAVESYEFLFSQTNHHIPPEPEAPGDHDGRTMLAADLGVIARSPEVSAVTSPVLAGSNTGSGSRRDASPSFHLERADGTRELLTTPVVIGRGPSGTAGSEPGRSPRLITIADDTDISRSHLRVAVEGDAVVVTDLGSKNGTVIILPGGAPRRLREQDPTVVLPGTLIDLGGDVTFLVTEP